MKKNKSVDSDNGLKSGADIQSDDTWKLSYRNATVAEKPTMLIWWCLFLFLWYHNWRN